MGWIWSSKETPTPDPFWFGSLKLTPTNIRAIGIRAFVRNLLDSLAWSNPKWVLFYPLKLWVSLTCGLIFFFWTRQEWTWSIYLYNYICRHKKNIYIYITYIKKIFLFFLIWEKIKNCLKEDPQKVLFFWPNQRNSNISKWILLTHNLPNSLDWNCLHFQFIR